LRSVIRFDAKRRLVAAIVAEQIEYRHFFEHVLGACFGNESAEIVFSNGEPHTQHIPWNNTLRLDIPDTFCALDVGRVIPSAL
jgi:hypothetical protein